MKQKKTVTALSLAFLLLVSSVAASAGDSQPRQLPTASYKDLQPLSRAFSLLQLVDLQSRDSRTFLYASLAGMIEGFDRYSYFVPPDMVSLFLDDRDDEYVGIGVHVSRTQDRNAEVLSVEEGSPAAKAGIAPKDLITALDGIPLAAMRSLDISRLLKGPDNAPGSEIRIRLRRPESPDERELVLTRKRLKIRTIESRRLQNSRGYVRVHQFKSNTPEELKEAITELRQDGGMEKGLILDLRNNPGGEMVASVDVARLFLDSGVIASLESNYPGLNAEFRADEPAEVREPLVVLINEGSASGAELVAGAIKHHRRGPLAGRRTFGKGTFQSFVPLTSEMGAYLTLGRYRLADGVSPEGKGVIPDIILDPSSDADTLMIAEQILSGP
ncbi:MAG: S41 family peptidase [Thermodesulfovibrionales bacterium]